ncbi:unnamed protein product [Sphagnum balticum]
MAGVLRKSLVPALLRFKTVSQMVAPQASKVMSTYVGMGSGGRCGGWAVRSPPDDIPFAIKALKHIAIAVPDLSIAAEHYRTAFGAQVSDPVDKVEDGMTVVYVQLPNLCIELVHPLGEKSPVATFLLENPKGGIHHVCLAVDDLQSASGYLGEVGVTTLGSPANSADDKPAMFLHPETNMGVLIKLQQANHFSARDDMPRAVGT